MAVPAHAELPDEIFGADPAKGHHGASGAVAAGQVAGLAPHKHARVWVRCSGTTKKPYKQKGTGNARQGSLRAPQVSHRRAWCMAQWFADHAFDLPKKVRRLGPDFSALSQKHADGKLVVIDVATCPSPPRPKNCCSEAEACLVGTPR